ncbi:hypothetical protein RHMOL_Rhmol01G0300100 [Rhododendron molle]|uniref:Uncharacterized protein n=1 Tax=Rhododendron molle TaxID=49168 RepID=A0ACC0Q903_RHOML|nr:hypothetical protein RHMOL_Rhmol01G0300100 [Rhododendron molle]
MDPSSAQQQQEMATQTLESMLVCPATQQLEKKPKPPQEQALKCPRCDSTNTKFCYYNNYSLTQPRYFCKSCKRYWTQGGTLRNVPVGGGCRKTKRSSPPSSKIGQDQPMITTVNPGPLYSSDLSLAFSGATHYEGVGNPSFHNPAAAAAMFLDPPGGFFQNLCYGMGNGSLGNVENGVGEMKPQLWGGIPWQSVGGDGSCIGDFDSSGKQSWNGIGSFNWHGLVNSPLM